MSSVVCKKTGIIIEVADGMLSAGDEGMLFFMQHPLAQYSQVRKTFLHSLEGNKYAHERYRPVLAGSLLTILLNYDLLKVHGDEQALWANNIICKQARSNGQLLSLITRLLNNEDKLKVIKEGFQVKGEVRKRQYKFCLEACMTQGQEREGANKHFLSNLIEWLGVLVPCTEPVQIIVPPTKHASLNIELESISLEDKSILNAIDGIIFDELLEGVKNNIEDRVYRRIKRVPIKDIKRRLLDMINLSREYGIVSEAQGKKLRAMVRNELLINKILVCLVDMLYKFALVERNQVKRNKAFEIAAWFKAADVEFSKRGIWAVGKAEQAFEEILGAGQEKRKESLQDKLARIKSQRSKA